METSSLTEAVNCKMCSIYTKAEINAGLSTEYKIYF